MSGCGEAGLPSFEELTGRERWREPEHEVPDVADVREELL